ncbi:hypothetical protein [Nocardiopsis sp. MG754419]|uniref:hypothetical protein n=1 Tax=Nocardiopsis sp. MG754419 TaxID=2259865 RepID=UPI002011ACF5|nr:hypothetical protein [Nocardiopsis sp. MG754419]
MRRTAILIGVNRYDDLAVLDSPRENVQAIERVLKANGHYDRVQPLLDRTRNEAMEALEMSALSAMVFNRLLEGSGRAARAVAELLSRRRLR